MRLLIASINGRNKVIDRDTEEPVDMVSDVKLHLTPDGVKAVIEIINPEVYVEVEDQDIEVKQTSLVPVKDTDNVKLPEVCNESIQPSPS